jgi:hypothetical protein
MPYQPNVVQGSLPNYDLKEYAETGILATGCTFTPVSNIREKQGHVPGTSGEEGGYAQILQVTVTRQKLDIELSGEIVPDQNGKAVGLANVHPGRAVALANFAASLTEGVMGFTYDAAKLLMVREPSREVGNEAIPTVTLPMSYYPEIAAPVDILGA